MFRVNCRGVNDGRRATLPAMGRLQRLRKLSFAALTVASALLFVAVCILWVRSYWHRDVVYCVTRDPITQWSLTSDSGGLWGNRSWRFPFAHSPTNTWKWEFASERLVDGSIPWRAFSEWRWRFAGFGWASDDRPSHSYRGLEAPYWSLAAMTACPLILRLSRTLRSRLRRKGFCPSCGYDLRASPDRCPECGTTKATA